MIYKITIYVEKIHTGSAMIPSCRHITASFVNRLSIRSRKSSSLNLHITHPTNTSNSLSPHNSTILFFI